MTEQAAEAKQIEAEHGTPLPIRRETTDPTVDVMIWANVPLDRYAKWLDGELDAAEYLLHTGGDTWTLDDSSAIIEAEWEDRDYDRQRQIVHLLAMDAKVADPTGEIAQWARDAEEQGREHPLHPVFDRDEQDDLDDWEEE